MKCKAHLPSWLAPKSTVTNWNRRKGVWAREPHDWKLSAVDHRIWEGHPLRVTVELNHESNDTFTDLYVTDLNFVGGAQP